MGIDLIWRDSAGVQRDAAHDLPSLISSTIDRVRQDRSNRNLLVSTIDPYGNTRFSTGQAPQLLREFELLRQQSANIEERIALGRVISILRASEGVGEDWLEFAGD
jgi:hypothetical protein